MNTFRSFFMRNSDKYTPVHEDVVVTDNDTPCIHCGQDTHSKERNSMKLWTHVGIVLVLAIILSASMTFGRGTRCVSGERARSPFTDVFGEVPIRSKEFVEDHRYIHSDPYDGTWDIRAENDTAKRAWTVWDDIYSGSWIEVPHPRTYGLPKGAPLLRDSLTSGTDEIEAYVPSILHQIHCMGELKHLLLVLEKGKTLPSLYHATHCVEYLRQVGSIDPNGQIIRKELWAGARFTNVVTGQLSENWFYLIKL
ncbi:hypothetical protein BP5796_03625 [Coleophoma crateriformis]|uniref:Uncharacterized protein n=1 Tax=Coleophoma crateriformis TaxID=565419 RepID=A0A3D8SP24_9HELO|nr:hypothetical protein BP5796_03625 [Coleophoma crateriformis]